jgi:hypothetical protein
MSRACAGQRATLSLPVEKMHDIGRLDGVRRVDVGGMLLTDALHDALSAGALYPHGDARIFCLEGLGQAFRNLKVRGRVEDDLAFLLCCLDEFLRHR